MGEEVRKEKKNYFLRLVRFWTLDIASAASSFPQFSTKNAKKKPTTILLSFSSRSILLT